MTISAKLQESSKFSVALAATWMFHSYNFVFSASDINTVAGAIASSSGTILGFLITAIALMASVMDRDLLKNLRATGGYRKLIVGGFVCAALHLTLLALSLSLLLPWANGKDQLLLMTVFTGALAAVYLATTGLSFYRVIISISKN